MSHISGDNIAGSHTTVIDGAEPIVKYLVRHPYVKKIAPGRIDTGRRTSGVKRCRIIEDTGCLVVAVSHNSAFQEIRVYASDIENVKTLLGEFVKEEGYEVSFHSRVG